MSGSVIESEWFDFSWAEANCSHFVEPGLDLSLKFRHVSEWTRPTESPSGSHILTDVEPI